MSTSRVRFILLTCALFVAPRVSGAVRGIFPGLSNLIDNSQAIVVASIESGPKTPRSDSSRVRAVQKVRVLYALKGDFSQGDKLDVALDPFLLFPTRTYLELVDFPIRERYVLFIAKDSLSPRGYGILNAEGSAFWIPRDSDVSVLRTADVYGNIELLLEAVQRYSESRQQALDQSVQQYLAD